MSRMRGFLWFAAGIVLALLAGVVAYTSLTRVVQTPIESGSIGPAMTVIAAARDLPARTLLTQELLVEIDLPAAAVPQGSVDTYDRVAGKLTMVPIYAGEPLLDQRLVDPNIESADGRRALFLNDDEVLMAIPAQDLLSRVGVLKPGDQIDLLYSLSFPESRGIGAAVGAEDDQQATFVLLQNVTIIGMAGSVQPVDDAAPEDVAAQAAGRPDALLVTLPPQDALTLKYVNDSGGILDSVLRAPGVERPFESDPVDIDYLINRYGIPTGAGR